MNSMLTEIKEKESKQIYKDLINGRIIPKSHFNYLSSNMESNHKFTSLFNNLDDFTQFYRHLGLELTLDEDDNSA